MALDLSNVPQEDQAEVTKLISLIASIDNTIERIIKKGKQSESFGGSASTYHSFESLNAQRERYEQRLLVLTGNYYTVLRGCVDMRRFPCS